MDKKREISKEKKLRNKRRNKRNRIKLLRRNQKKRLEKEKVYVPPVIKLHKLSTFCDTVRFQFSSALKMVQKTIDNSTDVSLVSEFQRLKISQPALFASTLTSLRKIASRMFGVWQPIIVLRVANSTYGGLPVVSDASAVFINSLAINVAQLASLTLLWAIFDEYRPVGPFKVYYTPDETAPTKCYGIGVIDYSNSASLFSVEEAMTYDTAQIFDVMPHRVPDSGVTEWRGHVIGIPDRQWVTSGVAAVIAYWKTYSYNKASSSWTTSFNYGSLGFKMPIEFRQLNQGG